MRWRCFAHDGFAHTHHALGNVTQASQHWLSALDILTSHRIGQTEDPQVTTEIICDQLASLDEEERVDRDVVRRESW